MINFDKQNKKNVDIFINLIKNCKNKMNTSVKDFTPNHF